MPELLFLIALVLILTPASPGWVIALLVLAFIALYND